jgi:hypothetical protein
MVFIFHVQPLDSDHLAFSVSQTFPLATIFAKKIAKGSSGRMALWL